MRRTFLHLILGAALAPLCFSQQLYPGPNVNMVSGTQWPTGDPFLQRQNEPSMAISSRNPLHILAGANDYRTVDIPTSLSGDSPDPGGDAWLGLFKSFDGGRTWISNLLPGYPQEGSAETNAFRTALALPSGVYAGADPGVRAGTNGLFYYAGLAFVRETQGKSAIFVARYIDDNNLEGADTFRYLGTTFVKKSNDSARGGNGGAQVNQATQTYFEDKPSIAVDIPRTAASCTIPGSSVNGVTTPTQTPPAGNVYMAWTEFLGQEGDNEMTTILFSSSSNCGQSFSTPIALSTSTVINQGATIAIDPNNGTVYVAWRVFSGMSADPDEILYVASTNYGQSFSKPQVVATVSPFDQGESAFEDDNSPLAFRTNAYPAMAVDNHGRVYVAWSQRCNPADRNHSCPPVNKQVDTNLTARIVFVTGSPAPHSCPGEASAVTPEVVSAGNIHWTFPPIEIDNNMNLPGHQFMPALAFSSGKLTAAWYDQRNDDQFLVYTPVEEMGKIVGGDYTSSLQGDGGVPDFGPFIEDPSNALVEGHPDVRRQTLDIQAAQLITECPDTATFGPSVQVSSYEFGVNPFDSQKITQLQVNPPNLPMFAMGTEPFLGDYIDIAGPVFLPNHDGTWRYNDRPGDPDYTQIVWTDNRDVIPPPPDDQGTTDDHWPIYVPPTYGVDDTSKFDGTKRPVCTADNSAYTGDRNQNIYTAALNTDFTASAPANFKQLGYIPGSTKQIERQFPINVQNNTLMPHSYKLSIVEPSTGASFKQTSSVLNVVVPIPAKSIAAQSVFVMSSDPHQQVVVNVQEEGGGLIPVTLNGDISNPNIENPNIENGEAYNPNIENPNIENPNIENPNIENHALSNPNIENPNIENITIANPNIENPNIENPNIENAALANPNIENPNIENPNIENGSVGDGQITDATWTITNNGNTVSSYAINVNTSTAHSNVSTQVILWQSYTTPAAKGCTLTVQSHYVPVSNTVLKTNGPASPTVALKPGESALITVRAFALHAINEQQAKAAYDPTTALKSVSALGKNTLPNSGSSSENVVSDITAKYKITTSPLVLQLGTTTYTGTITVENISNSNTVPGTYSLLLTNLPTNVTAISPTGTAAGVPYYLITSPPAVGSSIKIPVQFDDALNIAITFVPIIDFAPQ